MARWKERSKRSKQMAWMRLSLTALMVQQVLVRLQRRRQQYLTLSKCHQMAFRMG
jgi:hypothetical protein